MKIKEVIVVEGRYDKNTVSQLIDATVIETSGFGIFSDSEKLDLLRRLADKHGLIILTDSDGAGFLIRNFLKGALPKDKVKHAYIPDIKGKERRKNRPSSEGKLGVEGMKRDAIVEALRRAGATFDDGGESFAPRKGIGKADLYEDGLLGREDSSAKRGTMLKKLGLPERLTSGGLLEVLNILYTYEEYKKIVSDL